MLPPWLSGVRAVVQAVAGAPPALVLVVFAGVLGLIALPFEQGRRAYALDFADRLVGLAKVLVGGHQERLVDRLDDVDGRLDRVADVLEVAEDFG